MALFYRLSIVVVLLLAALAGWFSYQHWQRGPELNAQIFSPSRTLPAFELVDQHGALFSNKQLHGHWTLLFLGYTFCPDICPTTMAKMSHIYPQLKQQIPQLQMVMLSADPKRDLPERLDEYVSYFNPDFIGVTGEHSHLFPLTQRMGLVYAMVDSTEEGSYAVDHSASMVLLDPNGNMRARFRPQAEPGSVPTVSSAELLREIPLIISLPDA